MFRRALVLVVALAPACGGIPDLPHRNSPELVEVDAPYVIPVVIPDETGDDDPAWWDLYDGGWAVFTRQGRLTDPVPASTGPGQLRAFDDGTAITPLLDGGLARWETGSWTIIPFPELPNLTDESVPFAARAFDATSTRDAWFVLQSGHFCHYDGGEVVCTDASTGLGARVMYGPTLNDLVITPSHVFITHPQSGDFTDSTELYALDRSLAPNAVSRIGTATGEVNALYALAGTDQAVGAFEDDFDRTYSPLVIDASGDRRAIDLGDLASDGDFDLATSTSVVTLPEETFVVVSRSYTTTDCPEDDACDVRLRWSEIVVLRDRGHGPTEVGHLGIDHEGDPDPRALVGRAARVDGQLFIEGGYGHGWYQLAAP